MAKLDDILQKAIADIEGVFGCAVIDSDNRKLICVANKISALSPNYIEALAVAVVELVRGKQVQAIETLLSGKLNTPVANAIDEMCINAGKTRHFIAVFPGKANRLIVLSTDQYTSVAMGWIIMYRTIVPLISRGIFSQSPDA